MTENYFFEMALGLNRLYQIRYSRGSSRIFDSSKLQSIIGEINFVAPEVGLRECFGKFLDSDRKFGNVDILPQTYMDEISGEYADSKEFSKVRIS